MIKLKLKRDNKTLWMVAGRFEIIPEPKLTSMSLFITKPMRPPGKTAGMK